MSFTDADLLKNAFNAGLQAVWSSVFTVADLSTHFLINDSKQIEALFPEGSQAIFGKQFMHEMKSSTVIYWKVANPDEYKAVADPDHQ